MPEERTDAQTFKGNPLTLVGPVLECGTAAPDFKLLKNDLSEATLASYAGKVKILAVVPSLDTGVCDTETRRFNEEATALGNDVVVLGISRDLPFAQKRWCGAAGVDRVETLSDFRSNFGETYGVLIKGGPLGNLLARAVFVVDKSGKLVHQQIVPELTTEPDYATALEAAKKAVQG